MYNRRTDGGVIRRLRILQRASTSSQIGPKKVVVPGEIASLKQGQMSLVILGIDFVTPSDRDGNLLAKFDIKTNSGGIPVEFRPNLGQLLLPCKRTETEFNTGISKLQGFNRITSKFTISDPSKITASWIQKRVFVNPIITKGDNNNNNSLLNSEGGLRMVGSLPESGDPVFVHMKCTEAGSNDGTITVCCEQALAVNGIMNILKKALGTVNS